MRKNMLTSSLAACCWLPLPVGTVTAACPRTENNWPMIFGVKLLRLGLTELVLLFDSFNTFLGVSPLPICKQEKNMLAPFLSVSTAGT